MTVIKSDTTVLKNYINGQWVDAISTETLDVPNPATGEILAKVPISSKEDVELAVRAAKEAFKVWKNTPVPRRARILFKYQYLLTENHS